MPTCLALVVRLGSLTSLSLLFALAGCSLSTTAPTLPQSGAAIRGIVHGGEQPISGAHVYLFAANNTGYGGAGFTAGTANASVSLLNYVLGSTTQDTSSGPTDDDYYVTTSADGTFSISGDYSCTPGTQIYLYALGGNPGLAAGTNNAASGLLAIVGDCVSAANFAATTPTIAINEVSTIAAAYAFAGFATDSLHVSSSGTPLAQIGIANAFANAANLVSLPTGVALANTPAGNGTVPQSTINMLANILTPCVNSTGTLSGPTHPTSCYTLFYYAQSGGSVGTVPTDTATAAINIAHNPGMDINALYESIGPMPPFAPSLSPQPNDFTIGIQFTGGGLSYPVSVAIDGSGSAWVTNAGDTGISKFSSTGAALSPATGFTGGGLITPESIAIDSFGSAWVANGAYSMNSISKFSNAGIALSPSTGYTGGGLDYPLPIAIDASGNVWTANYQGSVSEFSNAGAALSPVAGYTGGGLYTSFSIAIDGSGDAWIANDLYPGSVSEFSSAGVALSPSTGYTGGGLEAEGPPSIAIDSAGNAWITNYFSPGSLSKFSNAGAPLSPSTGYTGGGLDGPVSIAIDGAGNAWIANNFSNGFHPSGSLSEFSSAGVALSPATGYASNGLSSPQSIAIDASGNAWVSSNYGSSVSEFIGIAAPVITPISAGLPTSPTANGISYLGTRP